MYKVKVEDQSGNRLRIRKWESVLSTYAYYFQIFVKYHTKGIDIYGTNQGLLVGNVRECRSRFVIKDENRSNLPIWKYFRKKDWRYVSRVYE